MLAASRRIWRIPLGDRTPRRGLVAWAGRAAAGAAAVLWLLVVCASGAGATPPDPSGELLARFPLSGYVAAPPGLRNGPIDQSNIDLMGGIGNPLTQAITNGDVSGAIRVWSHQPPNGTSFEMTVFRFANESQVPNFMLGFDHGVNGSDFAVPGLDRAAGYRLSVSVGGVTATEYVVAFSKGPSAFAVAGVTVTAALTAADVSKVALAQYRAAPSGGSGLGLGAYQVGEVIGGALLAILVLGIVIAVLRRSSDIGRVRWEYATAGPAPAAMPSDPGSDRPVGWHAVPGKTTEQAYWDGHAWTGQRFWTGTGWAEFPGV